MAKSDKLLVITSWAPPMIGGPQLFGNLISQWPDESYVILTGHAALTSGKLNDQWLPGPYVFYDHDGPIDRQALSRSSQEPQPSPVYSVIAWAKKVPVLGWLIYGALVLGKVILMVRAGLQAVRNYSCTALLGNSDHGPALISTAIVARLTGLPYSIYLFDLYRGNDLLPADRLLAWLFERTILCGAKQVFVTNEGTAAYYEARYGKQCRLTVIHNGVFPEHYTKRRTPYRPKPPYKILFTGHIYWAQEQSVLNLLAAMKELHDLPVELDLYVPDPSPSITAAVARHNNIRLLVAPQSAMPEIQSQATLLFLPLAWHTASPQIIQTATPGKFTDYLAAGRPILIHAPDYAYVSRYGREHRLALVVDQDDPQQLAQVIRDFLKDPSQGQQYIDQALQAFTQNHDVTKNSKRLRSLLFG